ncbi:unnamed protein product, partial [marine sediment metagenome]
MQGVNSSGAFAIAAEIGVEQRGAAGADFVPAELQFKTSNGVTANTLRMIIKESGRVGIGLNSPLGLLHIDQSVNDAAIPVLTLDQADIS